MDAFGVASGLNGAHSTRLALFSFRRISSRPSPTPADKFERVAADGDLRLMTRLD